MKYYEKAELTVFFTSCEDIISTSTIRFADAEGRNTPVFDGRDKFVPNS